MPTMSYTPNSVAAAVDLPSYTRQMHHYTFKQLGQMREAISNVAETADNTMRDRESAARVNAENNQVRERVEREKRENRDEVERGMSRESMRAVGGSRDFA